MISYTMLAIAPLIFVFVLIGNLTRAHASEPCNHFRTHSPALYDIYCKNGSSSSKPAGASSTFSSSFNINTASLPNEKSNYGLESIGSFVEENESEYGTQFALIKGFSKFGAGISTGSANIFYGNDVYRRLNQGPNLDDFDDPEPVRGKITNLNVGTSFSLLRFGKSAKLSLGTTARYNKITNTWGGGPALLFTSRYLTFGTGFTRERVSNTLPRVSFYSYTVSTRILMFEIQYDQLRDSLGLNLDPIHIGTLTFPLKRLILSGAVRRLNYVNYGHITQYHFAAQFLLSRRFSLGLLHNFIPGTNSVGLQIFL